MQVHDHYYLEHSYLSSPINKRICHGKNVTEKRHRKKGHKIKENAYWQSEVGYNFHV